MPAHSLNPFNEEILAIEGWTRGRVVDVCGTTLRDGELNGGVSEPEFWEIMKEVRGGGNS